MHADANGATATISVSIVNDSMNENTETFAIDLTGAAGAAIGATSRMTVSLTDDDPLPTVSGMGSW